MEPCAGDCDSQRYPTFPYGPGAENLFSTVLPIILSAMVVVISWLAGRFIDKIEVSTPGSLPRTKSGTVHSGKRAASHEKSDSLNFHSTASRGMGRNVKMLEGVQELDGISAEDDEQNRLYHEEYGSQASQADGDRYDALGDSPGAQGPSSQGPRSPSVYSHFSQSVFSQSAYGPSAYGPSQRRPGVPGSVYGHSQYGDGSSLGGSQYPGPVPSHFGASQMSSERTSYHTSNGGGSSGGVGGGLGSGKITAGVNPGAAGGRGGGEAMFGGSRQIPAPYGGGAGGRGVGGPARMLPPPSYNPNPHGNRTAIGVSSGLGLGSSTGGSSAGGAGGLMGSGSGGGAAATAAAAAAAAATAAVVAHDASGFNRGSPPPYSQAASTLPKEPRPSVDSRPSFDAAQARMSLNEGQERISAAAAAAAAAAVAGEIAPGSAPLVAPPPAGEAGPRSGFGESDSEPGSEIPSTFRG